MVDEKAKHLRHIQNNFDVKAIWGLASHLNILEESYNNDADIIIVVTKNNEVNIVSYQVACIFLRYQLKSLMLLTDF